jgi:hypothetical protein
VIHCGTTLSIAACCYHEVGNENYCGNGTVVRAQGSTVPLLVLQHPCCTGIAVQQLVQLCATIHTPKKTVEQCISDTPLHQVRTSTTRPAFRSTINRPSVETPSYFSPQSSLCRNCEPGGTRSIAASAAAALALAVAATLICSLLLLLLLGVGVALGGVKCDLVLGAARCASWCSLCDVFAECRSLQSVVVHRCTNGC